MNGKEKEISFKGKKVLVTGAGGFIGSHLSKKLYDLGAELRLFLRYTSSRSIGNLMFFEDEIVRKSEIIFGDLREKKAVEEACYGVDYIFHLGATISVPYSFEHPEEVFANNTQSTLNILLASLKNDPKKIVIVSSSEVYGTAKSVPIDEKHPLNPQSPYAASKVGSDSLSKSFYHTYGVPVLIVRPFNTYGPGQSLRAVISSIIYQAIRYGKVKIGRVDSKRDFNYVDDTVKGIILSALEGEFYGDVLNISSGVEYSIGEIIDKVSGILGKVLKVEVERERVRGDRVEVLRLLGDYSKAEKLIGYKPEISIEEGLKITIDFIKKHINFYDYEFEKTTIF